MLPISMIALECSDMQALLLIHAHVHVLLSVGDLTQAVVFTIIFFTRLLLVSGRQKIFYRYNLRTRQCTKEPLTEPFQPIEVVTGARFMSEIYVGSSSVPGASVAVDLYSGERTVEGRKCTLQISLS